MSALLSLAGRCEEATGPCRKLDCEILAALDWREADWEPGERTVREMVEKRGLNTFVKSASEGLSVWRHLPRPTASLDAALSLVPEGISAADILRHAIDDCLRSTVGNFTCADFTKALPRFVVSHCLRARAAMEGDGE